MFESTLKEKENGIEYYEFLPEEYVKLTNFFELFKLKEGTTKKTIENLLIREGLELIIYNPITKEYYPRRLYYIFDREKYNNYIKDGNLYIKKGDLIWQ